MYFSHDLTNFSEKSPSVLGAEDSSASVQASELFRNSPVSTYADVEKYPIYDSIDEMEKSLKKEKMEKSLKKDACGYGSSLMIFDSDCQVDLIST